MLHPRGVARIASTVLLACLGGCGGSDSISSYSVCASHEMAEAMTDVDVGDKQQFWTGVVTLP